MRSPEWEQDVAAASDIEPGLPISVDAAREFMYLDDGADPTRYVRSATRAVESELGVGLFRRYRQAAYRRIVPDLSLLFPGMNAAIEQIVVVNDQGENSTQAFELANSPDYSGIGDTDSPVITLEPSQSLVVFPPVDGWPEDTAMVRIKGRQGWLSDTEAWPGQPMPEDLMAGVLVLAGALRTAGGGAGISPEARRAYRALVRTFAAPTSFQGDP